MVSFYCAESGVVAEGQTRDTDEDLPFHTKNSEKVSCMKQFQGYILNGQPYFYKIIKAGNRMHSKGCPVCIFIKKHKAQN